VLVFIGDQAVAAFDARIQVLQQFSALRGFQPQRQFGDFDRLGVEVDPVEIMRENFAVNVFRFRFFAQRLEPLGDTLVLRREKIECGNEKSA